MKIYYLLICACLFCCCKGQVDPMREVMLSVVPEKIVSLEGEVIPITELIPSAVFRIDSFLIVLNQEENKMLKIYQAETFRYLGALVDKGRGPGEIIFCNKIDGEVENGKVKLWIRASQNYIGILDLNRSLENNEACWIQKFDFIAKRGDNFLYRPVFHLGDSVFLVSRAEEPRGFIPEGSFVRLEDGGIRIISNEGVKNFPASNSFWIKYNYITDECLDTIWCSDYKDLRDFRRVQTNWQDISPDHLKIAVAYDYMDQVLLMDLQTLRSKLITTDSELPLPYCTDGNEEFFYSGISCTNERIFAFRAFPETPYTSMNKGWCIHIFDWDGKLRYQVNVTHPLKYPFLDAEEGFLYATDEEDAIRKYDVKSFL